MRQLFITGILLFASHQMNAQIKGKILVNGKEFKTGSDSILFFEYKPLSAKITRQGKKFLSEFGRFHQSHYFLKDSVRIIIDPAQTPKEYKVVNNNIAEQRAITVANYLKRNYGITNVKILLKGFVYTNSN